MTSSAPPPPPRIGAARAHHVNKHTVATGLLKNLPKEVEGLKQNFTPSGLRERTEEESPTERMFLLRPQIVLRSLLRLNRSVYGASATLSTQPENGDPPRQHPPLPEGLPDLDAAASSDDLDELYDEQQVQFSTSSYPERDRRHRDAKSRAAAPPPPLPDADDDSDTSVILFPGQGSQFVGMARKLVEEDGMPAVSAMFERASQILDYDLLKLCLDGPRERLNETRFCQPAVVVTSLAAVEKLYKERPGMVENCRATAGFSVGEITALIFSGALSFEDGSCCRPPPSALLTRVSHILSVPSRHALGQGSRRGDAVLLRARPQRDDDRLLRRRQRRLVGRSDRPEVDRGEARHRDAGLSGGKLPLHGCQGDRRTRRGDDDDEKESHRAH